MAAQLSEYSTTTTSLESIITGELSCNSQSFTKIYKHACNCLDHRKPNHY